MEENLGDSIKQILRQYGIDTLLNGNRFCALVEDLAPNPALKLERRVLQRLNQENLLSEIYRIISQGETINDCSKLDLLLEEAGFSEAWKQLVFEMFQLKNGEEMIQNRVISENTTVDNHSGKIELDPELKEFIQDVVRSVSGKGPIIVEESLKIYTNWEHKSGMKIDRGFLSPYMVQNEEKGETILEDPYILITNETITSRQQISDILSLVMPIATSLLIIATDIEQKALSTLLKENDTFPCVAIRALGYGDRRIEILHDIAILTDGSAIISGEKEIKDLSLEMFGRASQVVVHYEDTIIVDGQGNKEQLLRRIEQIQQDYETAHSDFDREKLQERIENLTHGVAVIKVGGRKVSEIKQQMDMIENAIKIIEQEEMK